MPPNAQRLAEDHDYFVPENLLTLRNTRGATLRGPAAWALPTGTPSTGLVVNTAPGSEEHLLRLGAALEPVLP